MGAIQERKQVKVGVATIYRHRHSITAQQIIDELIRKQLRDIVSADTPDRLKYRDKLLEKLLPQRMAILQKMEITQRKEVDVTVTTQLRSYQNEIEAAVERHFLRNNIKQPLHPTQTDP